MQEADRFDALLVVWKRILVVRRARRVRNLLPVARRTYSHNAHGLAGVALEALQLRAMSVALRGCDVRQAVGYRTRMIALVFLFGGMMVAALASLVGPVLLVAPFAARELSRPGWTLAACFYLTLFASVCAWFFTRMRLSALAAVSRLCAGVGLIMVVVAAGLAQAQRGGLVKVWLPLAYGLLAGVAALALISLSIRMAGMLWVPILAFLSRHCGTMPPSRLVARRMCVLLIELHEDRGRWRRADVRAALLARLRSVAWLIEHWVPQTLWWSGVRGSGLVETRRLCAQAAATLRGYQWRLLDIQDRTGYDDICKELADAASRVAQGDWSGLTQAELPTRQARVKAFLRRLITPVALIAIAAVLPYLPWTTQADAAVNTIQVGLLVAALLHLTSVENAAQERTLGTLQ